MRLFGLTTACTSIMLLHGGLAWPGMQTTYNDLMERADSLDSTELIGDLATLKDSQLSAVGKDVKTIITGGGNPQSSDRYPLGLPPAIKGTSACAKDTCCIWQYISNDMVAAFRGVSGRCTNAARAAVRLGFHDSAGWSKATAPGGGADGSIVLAAEEMTRGDNKGLEEIVAQMKTWFNQYKSYGISMADLIQMGANVATVVCPLGPRVKSYVGRKDSSLACPDGLLPKVDQTADVLIKLFQDKTIQPRGLTSLIGAHTTSQQRFVDTTRAGDPQDSTPGIWDILFYKQTLGSAPPRVFRFDSDVALAKDSRVSPTFQAFAGSDGQAKWNVGYSREYIRLSLLGVYNINNLTDCSKVLPLATPAFLSPDQSLLDKWLSTTTKSDSVAQLLLDGKVLDSLTSLINSLLRRLRAVRREFVA